MSKNPRAGSSLLANLFRKPSLAQQRQRFLGEVMLAGPASTPLAVALAGGCLAAVAGLAFVVQVPTKLHAPGVLLPVGGLTTIQAEESGVIGQIVAHPGTTVAAGQLIMTLMVDRRLADGAGSYETRAESASFQKEMLQQRRQRERSAFEAKLESLRLRRTTQQSTLDSLDERLRNIARQVQLAAADHKRLATLALTGHIAKREVEPGELRLLQAEATLNQLRAQRTETQAAVKRLALDMTTEKESFEALDLSLAMESERLSARAVELGGLARRAIVAPIEGHLADLLVSPGESVTPGAALATLHRPNSPMEARLYLSSLVAGRAEPGQEAVLKLSTFPSRQFGVLRGKVIEMAATPMDPRTVRLVPNLLTPVYEARVELERQHMNAMGRNWSLRPGLSVDATIIETRRTLISWLLQPLIRGSGLLKTDAEDLTLANVEAGI